MQKVKLNLSDVQLRKIASAFKKKLNVTIQLAYENLIKGKQELLVNPQDTVKIEKAKREKKGVRLKLLYRDHKEGGFLPLLFAGLGALGAIASGSAAIANAIVNKKSKDKELEELKRHNKAIEGKGFIRKFNGKKRKKKKN